MYTSRLLYCSTSLESSSGQMPRTVGVYFLSSTVTVFELPRIILARVTLGLNEQPEFCKLVWRNVTDHSFFVVSHCKTQRELNPNIGKEGRGYSCECLYSHGRNSPRKKSPCRSLGLGLPPSFHVVRPSHGSWGSVLLVSALSIISRAALLLGVGVRKLACRCTFIFSGL